MKKTQELMKKEIKTGKRQLVSWLETPELPKKDKASKIHMPWEQGGCLDWKTVF